MDILSGESGRDLAAIIVLLVPIHQALIELYKLTGPKERQYWEALAFVVFGPRNARPAPRRWPSWLTAWLVGVPITLEDEVRRHWNRGSQNELIDGFLLRAVGDSPVTEISDADIKNVARIARSIAPSAIARFDEMLDELVRGGADAAAAAATLREFPEAGGELGQFAARCCAWLATEPAPPPPAVRVRLAIWRTEFREQFLPGVLRAERDLPNALKAAEFRYRERLNLVSVVLAVVEALVVALPRGRTGSWALLAFFVAFASLLLAPRGTKSLLDAVIGIGARLKP